MRALIVMAKAPRVGVAKTRLAKALGEEGAAALAGAFLRDTLQCCRRAAIERLYVCYAPHDARDEFRALAPDALLVPQASGDLGSRMCAAFAVAFEGGAHAAVTIGSDTPHLEPRTLETAFASLLSAPVVLGPATDGGYFLIGLRAPQPSLFEGIDWSTERVLAQTLERARAARLEVAKVTEMFDVDSADDLTRLRTVIGLGGGACPDTARVLRDLDARDDAQRG